MIPEIHRKIPDGLFGVLLHEYSRCMKTRCLRKYGVPEKGDTVLDIGSYIGEYAIPVSHTADIVYAIEPDIYAYERLQENVRGVTNVLPFNWGVAKSTDLQKFELATENADSAIENIGTDTPSVETDLVRCFRLEDLPFIDRVDFIKMDCEGYEATVLETLGEYRPKTIAVDVSEKDSAIKSWFVLKNMGYEIRENTNMLVGDYE